MHDRTVLWTRIEGRIGIKRSDDHITIPGYLMTQHDAVANENQQGTLGLAMQPVKAARVPRLRIKRGTWILTVDGAGTDKLNCNARELGTRRPTYGTLPLTIELTTNDAGVELACTLPKDTWAHVNTLQLVRRAQ